MSLLLGIIVGTGLLWILNLIVVLPLTKFLVSYYRRDFILTYILVDTLVLSLAGFSMGYFLGWFFLGIPLRKVAIPGLLGFVILSILGYVLNIGYI